MATDPILLRAAADVPRFDYIVALNAAYADYAVPVSFNLDSFRRMVEREAVRLESSAAALYEGQIVGLGLLGVRGRRAWIGGMGVLPEYRHQGIGRRVMRFLIAQARTLGLARIQLEVLTQNQGAFNLYRSLDFQTHRRLLILASHGLPPDLPNPGANPAITIQSPGTICLLRYLPEVANAAAPWQRDPESLWAMLDRLEGVSAHGPDGTLLGVCLWSGDRQQAGILALESIRQEAYPTLLGCLRKHLPAASFFYHNVPDDDPALPALTAAGFEETLSQYEMHLDLTQENQA